MRVLYVYSRPIVPLKGGIQRVTYNLAEEIRNQGHEVAFLSFNKDGEKQTAFQQLYVPNTRILYCEENIQFVETLTRQVGFDIIINQAGISKDIHNVLADAKTRASFFLVSCIHNSIFGGVENFERIRRCELEKFPFLICKPLLKTAWLKHFLCRLYIVRNRRHYRHLCQDSDRVVVLTKAMWREMRRMTGKTYPNVVLIPNGTNMSEHSVSVVERKKTFLYVGKLDYGYKRCDLLLPIWKNFSERHPDYHLMILGGGDVMEDMERYIRVENIRNVSFEGWQQPAGYYQKALGILMTSCSEGLPMVLIEAMSYGVIPFAYDAYEHIREIVDDGVDGFLATDNDAKMMADLMCYVAENKSVAAGASRQAVEKSHCFDTKYIIKKWLNLFQQ